VTTLLAGVREREQAAAGWDVPAARAVHESAADVPRLLAAVEKVLELHAEFRILEECDHAHIEDDVREGRAVVVAGDFIACQDGYLYSVCRACCTGGTDQTEECASNHRHCGDECWPCPTVEAISRALLGEGEPDA
jgi:hypothetical protein